MLGAIFVPEEDSGIRGQLVGEILRGADPLRDFAGRESLKKGIRCKSFKINGVVIAL